eukprot:6483450-Amphidinium_carterae.1
MNKQPNPTTQWSRPRPESFFGPLNALNLQPTQTPCDVWHQRLPASGTLLIRGTQARESRVLDGLRDYFEAEWASIFTPLPYDKVVITESSNPPQAHRTEENCIPESIRGVRVQVPQQLNAEDCGVYLLEFARQQANTEQGGRRSIGGGLTACMLSPRQLLVADGLADLAAIEHEVPRLQHIR